MTPPRSFFRVFFVLTAFGILSLLSMASSSAFANIRAVDAVRLVAIGMCFGGAIVSLMAYFRSRP